MILNHIGEGAGFLIVFATAFDTDRFGSSNLHVVDILAAPERLKDAVAEAQGEDILDGFLAEIVIDAVDVLLAEDLMDLVAELACAGEIMAEGLLDNQAAPVVGAGRDASPRSADPNPRVIAAYWLGWVERQNRALPPVLRAFSISGPAARRG